MRNRSSFLNLYSVYPRDAKKGSKNFQVFLNKYNSSRDFSGSFVSVMRHLSMFLGKGKQRKYERSKKATWSQNDRRATVGRGLDRRNWTAGMVIKRTMAVTLNGIWRMAMAYGTVKECDKTPIRAITVFGDSRTHVTGRNITTSTFLSSLLFKSNSHGLAV